MTAGQPISRVEGPLKVTGHARYAADNNLSGMVHGVLVGAPFSVGRITAINTAGALNVPGVVRVLTRADMPKFGEVGEPAGVFRLPMQSDRIEYEGEPVAIVLAETLEAAEAAAHIVEISMERGTPIAPGNGKLEPAPTGGPLGDPFSKGDLADGLSRAAKHVRQTYTQPGRHHNPMETSATLALWQGEKVTLYDAVQHGANVPIVFGQALGLKPENVHVLAPHTGGGFGCKGYVWPHQLLTAVAARIIGRPVKISLTRAQMYTMVTYQAIMRQEVELGAAADGQLTALRHDVITVCPQNDTWSEPSTEIAKTLYACPAILTSQTVERTNVSKPNPMRAPVEGPGSWALESAMDELALSLGLDPLDLRIAAHADVDPKEGKPWSSKKLLEAYESGAERYGWRTRSSRPRDDGPWRIGHGMATATMGNFRFPAEARVRLTPDGHASVECSTQDIGTGTQTIFSQIAAEALGLPFAQVSIQWGDSALPTAGPVYGSSATMGTGGAILVAAQDAKAKLAQRVGAAADGLDVTAALRKTNAEFIGEGKFTLPGNAPFNADGADTPYAMRTWGAIFVEVGVERDFGLIRLRRAVGSYSAGRIINPKTARSQMIGGVIWGWGMAALEQSQFEPTYGRWLAKNLSNVSVPVNADIPSDIQIHFVDEFDPHASPTGARGIGELAATGVAAAVANAVYDAVGVRVRDLPITPGKLLPAITSA
jgi:xanthine dehydrogenase YagR molybdenum-binding subunit